MVNVYAVNKFNKYQVTSGTILECEAFCKRNNWKTVIDGRLYDLYIERELF